MVIVKAYLESENCMFELTERLRAVPIPHSTFSGSSWLMQPDGFEEENISRQPIAADLLAELMKNEAPRIEVVDEHLLRAKACSALLTPDGAFLGIAAVKALTEFQTAVADHRQF